MVRVNTYDALLDILDVNEPFIGEKEEANHCSYYLKQTDSIERRQIVVACLKE